nr:glycoside hydrolase family 65 protein [Pseudopedobacter sp.]
MKNYIKTDEWNIIEEGFHPHHHKISESIFSLGNGRFGQRANFEESYSGESMLGNYVAGVYYPDKTRVGWWKNGYPEYFAKVLNATNWIGIHVKINGEELDLAKADVKDFHRVLRMKEGYLERSFEATLRNGVKIKVNAKRFLSIADDEIGAIKYAITPLSGDINLEILSPLDGDISNQDSNYDEKFWIESEKSHHQDEVYLICETKKTAFQVAVGTKIQLAVEGVLVESDFKYHENDKYAALSTSLNLKKGEELAIYKYAVIISSMNYEKSDLMKAAKNSIQRSANKGFESLLKDQENAWAAKWKESDIVIEGDVAAQQGIRFNIFQLNQTYTGEDERLNIGPKGFTGEKYGGSTYWDTEAYCLPFYLATAEEKVAKNLLIYRYKHLQKAIENAEKLGFTNGAALYPMVTMNGEECHNEWEITFEEIHRNGAIAFAIYNYIRYTNDAKYLADYGLEVLLGISRFWAQRVNWSEDKNQYVMLGVTGPNEYENNINNNFYTSYLAAWCLEYTSEALKYVQENHQERFYEIVKKTNFKQKEELGKWAHIRENMYLAKDEKLGIFLQQDGYLDKEQTLVSELSPADRPLNQKWSWDRILRSCFIKQADVLQGLYLFEDRFDTETLKRNFDFYEPRTVHESSLSPCVHAIIAAKLGDEKRAYEFYLRTSRLDLDDYNNDTEDGCHTTSMAGTWMAVVEGFGGMRVKNGMLSFNPFIPANWKAFSFKIRFRGSVLDIKVNKYGIKIENLSDIDLCVKVFDITHQLDAFSQREVLLEGAV